MIFCELCGNTGTVLAKLRDATAQPFAFKCFCLEGMRSKLAWPTWDNTKHLRKYDPEIHDLPSERSVDPRKMAARAGQIIRRLPYADDERIEEA